MPSRPPRGGPRNSAREPERRTEPLPPARLRNAVSMTYSDSERVLVLDFGSQYGQLIARRVREQNVFCQIARHDVSVERVRALEPRGIILSGGPSSVYDAGAPHCDPALFSLGIPVLGICYGMQLAC